VGPAANSLDGAALLVEVYDEFRTYLVSFHIVTSHIFSKRGSSHFNWLAQVEALGLNLMRRSTRKSFNAFVPRLLQTTSAGCNSRQGPTRLARHRLKQPAARRLRGGKVEGASLSRSGSRWID
jgi:hypothetical protein